MVFLLELVRKRSGAAAIEYALIAGGISVVIAGSVAILGSDVQALYQAVADAF